MTLNRHLKDTCSYIWSTSALYLLSVRSISNLPLLCIWSISGLPLLSVWSISGLPLLYIWSISNLLSPQLLKHRKAGKGKDQGSSSYANFDVLRVAGCCRSSIESILCIPIRLSIKPMASTRPTLSPRLRLRPRPSVGLVMLIGITRSSTTKQFTRKQPTAELAAAYAQHNGIKKPN